jgi:hypothetical protein
MLDCERLLWSLLARYGGCLACSRSLIICMARGGAQCCLDYVSEGNDPTTERRVYNLLLRRGYVHAWPLCLRFGPGGGPSHNHQICKEFEDNGGTTCTSDRSSGHSFSTSNPPHSLFIEARLA